MKDDIWSDDASTDPLLTMKIAKNEESQNAEI